jgi:MoxR-like ATPase
MSIKKEEASIEEVKKISSKIHEMKKEMSKIISGQEEVINSFLRALICNGHVFVEGVPGIAKTLIVRVLGIVSGCDARRVQFTVDLLPSDIVGLTIYKQGKGFEIIKGPVFTNFLIADEINRSPPKTQSALLEAMQEKQVTIGRESFSLPKPFFVMATANPIEQSGVYTLPEAQLDRFLFKVKMDYPSKTEEKAIMKENIDLKNLREFGLKKVCSPDEIIKMQEIVKKVYIREEVENYILDIVEATRDKRRKHGRYIEWGASPRASIAFYIASKAEALMNGRNFVTPADVKKVAFDVLRHRILLSYEAEAEGITTDKIIEEILEEINIS